MFYEEKQMSKKRRTYTDAECSAAFLTNMAKKASKYGINDTEEACCEKSEKDFSIIIDRS